MLLRPADFFLLLICLFFTEASRSQSHDLSYYLTQGKKNSPLMSDYTNQYQLKSVDSLLAVAGRKISVTASGQILIAPIIHSYGYDEAITNQGQYSALIGVKQPLFRGKYISAQIQQSTIQFDSLHTQQLVSERELEKAITDQYLNSYDTLLQLRFEEQLLASLENQLKLLVPLVKSGIYLQTDYLALQLQVKTEGITLMQLRDDYRSNLYTLNALCGIPDTSTIELIPPDIIWKSSTYAVNPNLQLYSLDSISIEASKNLLKYNYVPKVNLAGDAGYNAIPTNFSVKKFGFSAGVMLDWNLYDGGLRNLHMQQLKIRQTRSTFYRSFYKTQLALQLADLDKKYQNSALIIQQWQNQLQSVNELISLRKQEFQTGQLSVIDYLITLREYRNIQQNLNQAQVSQQRIINEHNYLVW